MKQKVSHLVNKRLKELLNMNQTVVWTNKRYLPLLEEFAVTKVIFPEIPEQDYATVVVVGGGKLIDFSKVWRKSQNRSIHLVAVPSLWGSAAEVSPIAVINKDKKEIHTSLKLIPNEVILWDALVKIMPDTLSLSGQGDAWSHLLEGFLSPLSDLELRLEAAQLIRKFTETDLQKDIKWFGLSQKACMVQARSGVGLIHGIAHTLEPLLKKSGQHSIAHHAILCSTLLYPVMSYNFERSEKMKVLFIENKLNLSSVFDKLKYLYNETIYDAIFTLMKENWKDVIKNPLSRINSSSVAMGSLDYFGTKSFYDCTH